MFLKASPPEGLGNAFERQDSGKLMPRNTQSVWAYVAMCKLEIFRLSDMCSATPLCCIKASFGLPILMRMVLVVHGQLASCHGSQQGHKERLAIWSAALQASCQAEEPPEFYNSLASRG